MFGRHLWAPVRGLVLFVLGLTAVLQLIAIAVGTLLGSPDLTQRYRVPLNVYRTLASRWCEVEISLPYQSPPSPPLPEHDGWYRYKNRLYRSPKKLAYERRWDWLFKDPATFRDILWMVLNPFVGSVTALLPLALMVAGAVLPFQWQGHANVTVPVAFGAVLVGFGFGPAVLYLHGRWTAGLLGPARGPGIRRALAWIGRAGLATWRLAFTAGLAIAELAAALLHLLAMVPVLLWAWPTVVVAGRQLTSWRRHQIQEWTGIRIESPYLPSPALPPARPDGTYQIGRVLYRSPEMAVRALRYRQHLRDPATWRDLAWLLLNPLVSVFLAVIPVVITAYCVFGLIWSWAWALLLQIFVDFDTYDSFPLVSENVPIIGSHPVATAPLLGVVGMLLGASIAVGTLRLHGLWSRSLLAPTRSARLDRRVNQLAETRTEARATLVTELRRIERDLHDGAQAQWVAMGMKLGAIETLIDRDPAAAKTMVASAREASGRALVELRDLIRGINPPVLAERGFVDAIRGLVMDSPLPVSLRIELPGRPERPVEAAAYFAISELLANTSKYAADTDRVVIDIRHEQNRLTITMTDNGPGGADPSKGSGLRGIQRRLATFDGSLHLDSPLGGPTKITLEIPCVLSS